MPLCPKESLAFLRGLIQASIPYNLPDFPLVISRMADLFDKCDEFWSRMNKVVGPELNELKHTFFRQYPVTNCVPIVEIKGCLLYTSPSPRDATLSRMPSSA